MCKHWFIFLSSGDLRPGLVSKQVARQHMQSLKHKEANATSKVKPRKQLEAEKREKGLQQSIGSDNKGFAMLQKMGFKPGMSLGKKGTGFSCI